jgi:hypothetical protein
MCSFAHWHDSKMLILERRPTREIGPIMVFVAQIHSLWNTALCCRSLAVRRDGPIVSKVHSYAFATISRKKKLHCRSVWLVMGKERIIASIAHAFVAISEP